MSQNPGHDALSSRRKVIARLREVISALDRRQPQMEREGERRIAKESAVLKRKAQEQLAELEASTTTEVAAS